MPSSLYLRLAVFQFMQFFIWGSWAITTGTYLKLNLGFSGREVGLVYACTALGAMISPFWMGRLADQKFPIARILACLHFIGGLLMFFISTRTEFGEFYPLFILYTLCYMPTFALSTSLTFQLVESPAKQYPLLRLWGTIGWIATSVVLGYFSLETTVLPLRFSATASLLQAAYVLTLPITTLNKDKEQSSIWQVGANLIRDRNFFILLIAISIACIPNAFYYSFVTTFLEDRGFAYPAWLMSLGQLTEILFMAAMPWVRINWGLRIMVGLGLVAWGGRYLLMAAGNPDQGAWMVYLGLGLHGLAFTFTALAGQIYVDEKVPRHLRSTAQGFISMITVGIGAFFGSLMAGEIVDWCTKAGAVNWEQVWMVPGWIGIFGAVFFGLCFRVRG